MFKRSTNITGKNRTVTEGDLLDALCDLAVERHFQNYIKTVSKYRINVDSSDMITTTICEALVKDLENEIWQRIASRMEERVEKMKKLAMEATGGHRIVK